MWRRWLVMMMGVVVGGLLIGASMARADEPRVRDSNIFDRDGVRAVRAVVTLGEALPEGWGEVQSAGWSSSMTRRLEGVLAELRGPGVMELRATQPVHPRLGDAGGAERIAVVHLWGERGAAWRVVVVRRSSGEVVAMEMDAESPRRAVLNMNRWQTLGVDWPAYRGTLEGGGGGIEPGVLAEVAKPLAPGRWHLDKETLSQRFWAGRPWTVDAVLRALDEQMMHLRVPVGYDPRRPVGLVVWIDPSMEGRPPEGLVKELDALGWAVVAPDRAGNARKVADRYQLALDAARTAMERVHVDPRRVYVAGFSGGGRVAVAMVLAAGDVFTGALAIGGATANQPVPNGMGQFWPSLVGPVRGARLDELKTRPIAAITGGRDFNQRHVENALDLLKRQGLRTRVWTLDDVDHAGLVGASPYGEALRWVDAVYQDQRASEVADAERLLKRAMERAGESASERRRALVRVTEVAPWSEPAWRAWALLKGSADGVGGGER